MGEMLRWRYRIVMYVILYIVWSFTALLILAFVPSMSDLEAIDVPPAGWLTIAAAFFADVYFTQLRGKK